MASAQVEIKAKMNIDTDSVEKQARDAGKKAGNAVSNEISKGANGLDKGVTNAVRNASKGLKMIGGQISSMFGRFGTMLGGGKIGLIVGAVALIGQGIRNLIDKMTLTTAERLKKLDVQFESHDREKADYDNYIKNGKQYLNHLNELNKKEELTIGEKKQIISLLEIMNRQYGDLGIAIDGVTQKMTGLDTAGRMLDSASRIKAVQTLIKQFEILQKKTIINRDFLDAGYFDKVSKFFDELIPFETQKSYVKNNGRLFSTVLGSFTHLFNPLAGLTTGLGLDFLDKKFQSNVATAEFNLKPLLEQRQTVLERIQKATTESQIEELQKLLSYIDQKIKIFNELKKLPLRDLTTQTAINAEASRQAELIKSRQRMQRDNAYNNLPSDKEKIDMLQGELNRKEEQLKALRDTVANGNKSTVQGLLSELVKERAEYQKKISEETNPEKIMGYQIEVASLDGRIANLESRLLKISQAESQIEVKLNEQLQIKQQIEAIEKRSTDYYKNNITDLETQLRIQKLILQGKYEEAEQARIIADLQRQGLKVNRDKVNAQASKVNELNQFNVKRTLKDQIDSVTLRANPGNVDMQVKQRIKDLERSNKTKLSDAQKKTVEALVKLQNHLNNRPSAKSYQVQTNELTARGGFSGASYIPSTKNYQQQIATYTKRTSDLLAQIKNSEEKI